MSLVFRVYTYIVLKYRNFIDFLLLFVSSARESSQFKEHLTSNMLIQKNQQSKTEKHVKLSLSLFSEYSIACFVKQNKRKQNEKLAKLL